MWIDSSLNGSVPVLADSIITLCAFYVFWPSQNMMYNVLTHKMGTPVGGQAMVD